MKSEFKITMPGGFGTSDLAGFSRLRPKPIQVDGIDLQRDRTFKAMRLVFKSKADAARYRQEFVDAAERLDLIVD